jgi:hypothetical protein
VFNCENSTENVLKQSSRDIVYNFMTGINGSIFGYGQTMSGKTFTMLGSVNYPRILPFALLDVYEDIEKVFYLSFMEIKIFQFFLNVFRREN